MAGHTKWSDVRDKAIYEHAKDRNRGREPDDLHLAYERELWRLRVVEQAARVMAERLQHQAVCKVHPEAEANVDDCPFCADRHAYRLWQAASKFNLT